MRPGANVHGRRRSRRLAATHVDLDPALEALEADAVRRFIRAYAATLDDEPRAALADALLEHATRHGGGYRPKTPGAEAVREAEGALVEWTTSYYRRWLDRRRGRPRRRRTAAHACGSWWTTSSGWNPGVRRTRSGWTSGGCGESWGSSRKGVLQH